MKLDNTQKILVIGLVIVGSYLLLYLLLSPFFSFGNTHTQMMGFATQQNTTLNIILILLSIGVGLLMTYLIKPKEHNQENKQREIEIIKKALSDDEKKALEEIQKAGEITQDSLRFRLNWSKAKVSAILTNLDRLNIIQRQRQGKTYKVFLQNKK